MLVFDGPDACGRWETSDVRYEAGFVDNHGDLHRAYWAEDGRCVVFPLQQPGDDDGYEHGNGWCTSAIYEANGVCPEESE